MNVALRLLPIALCSLAIACNANVPTKGGDPSPTPTQYPSTKTTFGDTRPVELHIPKSYDRAKASPLIIVLHGYGASGAAQSLYFGFDNLVDEAGVLLAAPDGTLNSGGQRFWNATDYCCNFEKANVDDVAYLTQLIQDISAEYHVDAKRVFIVGHSNGGFMAYRMACERADLVAGIVSLAGAMWLDTSKCTPKQAVNVLQIHGTQDKTILYDGQPTMGGMRGYPGALASVEQWKNLNPCAGGLMSSGDPFNIGTEISTTMVTPQNYVRCITGGEVDLWTVDGGGHIPPLGDDFRAKVWAWLSVHGRY